MSALLAIAIKVSPYLEKMSIFWHSRADKPECEPCQGMWTIRPPMDAIHQMFESMHQYGPDGDAEDVNWPVETIWNQRLLPKADWLRYIFDKNTPLLRIFMVSKVWVLAPASHGLYEINTSYHALAHFGFTWGERDLCQIVGNGLPVETSPRTSL